MSSHKINLKMYSVYLVGESEAQMRHKEMDLRGKETQWTVSTSMVLLKHSEAMFRYERCGIDSKVYSCGSEKMQSLPLVPLGPIIRHFAPDTPELSMVALPVSLRTFIYKNFLEQP